MNVKHAIFVDLMQNVTILKEAINANANLAIKKLNKRRKVNVETLMSVSWKKILVVLTQTASI